MGSIPKTSWVQLGVLSWRAKQQRLFPVKAPGATADDGTPETFASFTRANINRLQRSRFLCITSPLAPTKITRLFVWNGLIASRNDSQQKNCQGIAEFFRPRERRGKLATDGSTNSAPPSWLYRVLLVPPTQISFSILNPG